MNRSNGQTYVKKQEQQILQNRESMGKIQTKERKHKEAIMPRPTNRTRNALTEASSWSLTCSAAAALALLTPSRMEAQTFQIGGIIDMPGNNILTESPRWEGSHITGGAEANRAIFNVDGEGNSGDTAQVSSEGDPSFAFIMLSGDFSITQSTGPGKAGLTAIDLNAPGVNGGDLGFDTDTNGRVGATIGTAIINSAGTTDETVRFMAQHSSYPDVFTWTISGTNTYLGLTHLRRSHTTLDIKAEQKSLSYLIDPGSTLQISGENVIADTASITLEGALTHDDPSFAYPGNYYSLDVNYSDQIGTITGKPGSTIDLADGTTLAFGDTTSAEISSTITGADSTTLKKKGTGTQILSGTNENMLGTISINEGTLAITGNNSLGSTGTGKEVLISKDGILDLRNVDLGRIGYTVDPGATIQTSTGTSEFEGNIAITNQGSQNILNFDVNGTQLTVQGVISGVNNESTGIRKSGSGTLILESPNNYTGSTNINAGVIQFGSNNAVNANSNIVLRGGTVDFNGFGYGGTIELGAGGSLDNWNYAGDLLLNGGQISNSVLSGDLDAIGGGKLENTASTGSLRLTGGTTLLGGTNAFETVVLNRPATLSLKVPTNGSIPLTVSNMDSNGGKLEINATGLSQSELTGRKMLISGNVTDAVAENSYLTYEGQTQKFDGFNQTIAGLGLYDVELNKGSLSLSIQRKEANEICSVTGLCGGGLRQNLKGVDQKVVRDLYGNVVLPALTDGTLHLPFWTTQRQVSRYLISGLMPRNIDAAGTVLSSYNSRLTDTLFERLPLRQFEPEAAVAETVIKEVKNKEPVRGLWKTSGEFQNIKVDGKLYRENPSLVKQYAKRENLRAWFRGFGGDVAASRTSNYLYKAYTATNAGGVAGLDYNVAENVQIGAFANYGSLSINTDQNSIVGSGAWNPSGWGGGITADYWGDSFYIQGLIGASDFSGNQIRGIPAIGGGILDVGRSLSGEKNVTSIVGAIRAGAPIQVGDFYLEPQLQATWTGNQEDAFSEGGNGNLKLNYNSRNTNFLQTEVGIKVAYPITIGKTDQLVPVFRFAWLGDWDMNNKGQEIGYQFSNQSIELDSYQENQMGALIEAGIDYTMANIGATSFKIYGRGGAEVWGAERGTNWRASGGMTFQF